MLQPRAAGSIAILHRKAGGAFPGKGAEHRARTMEAFKGSGICEGKETRRKTEVVNKRQRMQEIDVECMVQRREGERQGERERERELNEQRDNKGDVPWRWGAKGRKRDKERRAPA